MRITEAAQKVQRSGFPEAYEDHATDGRALASALTGYSPAAFSCVVDPASTVASAAAGCRRAHPPGRPGPQRPARAFGDLPLGGFAARRGLDRAT